MTISEVKNNLGKPVRFSNKKLFIESAMYILTGCILRKGDKEFYYQAELTDVRNNKSVIICRFDEIEKI